MVAGSDSNIFSFPSGDPSFAPSFDPPPGRIVAGMATCNDPISLFVAHVEALGATTAGRRLSRRWLAEEPLLADLAGEAAVTEGGVAAGFVGAAGSGGWMSAGRIAAACRAAGRVDQERIVECLCRLGAGDELACLTVVSGLTVRLGSVLSGWSRAGAAGWELDGLASDLLSACWSGVAGLAGLVLAGEPLPGRVVCYLLDGAVEAVRVPRRCERRRAGLRSAFVERAGCVTGKACCGGSRPEPGSWSFARSAVVVDLAGRHLARVVAGAARPDPSDRQHF